MRPLKLSVRGNLSEQESYQRFLGGRKRINAERQRIAADRRENVLMWLLRHRRNFWCALLGEWVRVERIIVRWGDAAELAREFEVSRATICRDLSFLAAVHPWDFGRNLPGVDPDEYLAAQRYSARMSYDSRRPEHDLRKGRYDPVDPAGASCK